MSRDPQHKQFFFSVSAETIVVVESRDSRGGVRCVPYKGIQEGFQSRGQYLHPEAPLEYIVVLYLGSLLATRNTGETTLPKVLSPIVDFMNVLASVTVLPVCLYGHVQNVGSTSDGKGEISAINFCDCKTTKMT